MDLPLQVLIAPLNVVATGHTNSRTCGSCKSSAAIFPKIFEIRKSNNINFGGDAEAATLERMPPEDQSAVAECSISVFDGIRPTADNLMK